MQREVRASQKHESADDPFDRRTVVAHDRFWVWREAARRDRRHGVADGIVGRQAGEHERDELCQGQADVESPQHGGGLPDLRREAAVGQPWGLSEE